jgi:hypothetical protein
MGESDMGAFCWGYYARTRARRFQANMLLFERGDIVGPSSFCSLDSFLLWSMLPDKLTRIIPAKGPQSIVEAMAK